MSAHLAKVAVLPPQRSGSRPRMSRALPHLQLEQLPPAEVVHELLRLSVLMPGVHTTQSRMASPDTTALFLADELAFGPPQAFIDRREFCHLQPVGLIHLTIPIILGEELIRLAWAEWHPLAQADIVTNLITVYAPRNADELAAVLGVVDLSRQFAAGALQALYSFQRRQRVS